MKDMVILKNYKGKTYHCQTLTLPVYLKAIEDAIVIYDDFLNKHLSEAMDEAATDLKVAAEKRLEALRSGRDHIEEADHLYKGIKVAEFDSDGKQIIKDLPEYKPDMRYNECKDYIRTRTIPLNNIRSFRLFEAEKVIEIGKDA